MKRTLIFALVITLLTVSIALAAPVNSRENEDITEVEIIEVIPTEPEPEPNPQPEPEPEPEIEPNPFLEEKEPEVPEVVVEVIGNTDEVQELIEDMQVTYQVTVRYIYTDGTTAADTYQDRVDVGQIINFPVPTIDGYFPTGAFPGDIMPQRDVEYTVIYVGDGLEQELLNINDYETPLGLGFSLLNIGVCIE